MHLHQHHQTKKEASSPNNIKNQPATRRSGRGRVSTPCLPEVPDPMPKRFDATSELWPQGPLTFHPCHGRNSSGSGAVSAR